MKPAVLKTAVRETVPGVRIPLPPPLTQLVHKHLASFIGQWVRSCLVHPEHRWSTITLPRTASSLQHTRRCGFDVVFLGGGYHALGYSGSPNHQRPGGSDSTPNPFGIHATRACQHRVFGAQTADRHHELRRREVRKPQDMGLFKDGLEPLCMGRDSRETYLFRAAADLKKGVLATSHCTMTRVTDILQY